MEMDQVYIELAPKAGTIRQLRAEADAYRAARSAKPQQGTRLGRVRAVLTAVLTSAASVKQISATDPITEE